MAIFAVWLLIVLPAGQQQLKASPKNDTASQQTRNAGGSVVPVKDNAPSHGNTADAAEHQHATGKKPPPALTPLTRTERFSLWLDSLGTADWTLIVTTLYLIATVLIWLAMLASNKHAENAYNEGKDAANADRELMRQQLAAMKDSAEAAERQVEMMMLQVRAAVVSAESVHDSAMTTRRQLEAYERPWVTGSLILDGVPECLEHGLSVSTTLTLRNVGHSVATHIKYAVHLFPTRTTNDASIGAGYDDIANIWYTVPGYALFAGDECSIPKGFFITNELFAANSELSGNIHAGFQMYAALCLVGIATYRFPASDSEHTTRFAYYIGYPNSEAIKWQELELRKDHPALGLYRLPFSHAD